MAAAHGQIAMLLQSETLLSEWLERVRRKGWSLRAGRPGGEPGQVMDVLRERCRHVLRTLAQAVADTGAFEAGSASFREPVQSLAFTAGWMEGAGLAVTDALALVHALEEVLLDAAADAGPPIPHPFFEALAQAASEAYCAAIQQRAHARYRDAMEKAQLVASPHPRLPCLFLVGDPDLQALDDAIGRLMMVAMMSEAKAVVIDGTGLLEHERVMGSVLELLLDDSRALPTRFVLVGAATAMRAEVARSGAGDRVALFETLAEARSRSCAGRRRADARVGARALTASRFLCTLCAHREAG